MNGKTSSSQVPYHSGLILRSIVTALLFLLIGLSLGFIGRLQVSGHLPADLTLFYKLITAHPLVLFAGWSSLILMGIMYYVVPKLTGRPLWSEKVATVCYWLVTIASIGVIAGGSTARYTALFPLKHTMITMISLALVLVAIFLNFLQIMKTLSGYQGPKHPTLYYFSAAVIMGFFTLAIVGVAQLIPVFFPRVWLDPVSAKHFIWLGLHTFANQWVNVSILGALYFAIPMATGRPIFSEKGAVFGLILYMVFNVVAYFHHLLMDPIPLWQKLFGQYFTWLLLVTSTLTIYNLVKTSMGGKWNLPMSFYMVGLVSLAIEGLIGAFHGTIVINQLVHNTQAITGYVHIVLFLYVTVCGMGLVYQFLPEITGRELFSERLGQVHLWLTTIGGYGMSLSLLIAGYLNPAMPRVVLKYDPIFQPLMNSASAFSAVLVLGQVIFAYNMYRTLAGARVTSPRLVKGGVEA